LAVASVGVEGRKKTQERARGNPSSYSVSSGGHNRIFRGSGGKEGRSASQRANSVKTLFRLEPRKPEGKRKGGDREPAIAQRGNLKDFIPERAQKTPKNKKGGREIKKGAESIQGRKKRDDATPSFTTFTANEVTRGGKGQGKKTVDATRETRHTGFNEQSLCLEKSWNAS